ncbi:MAG TPA: hypothetical protein VLI06_00445 [Solimonas sp.]|nr:hypothetical protein [Solimonas sp.]
MHRKTEVAQRLRQQQLLNAAGEWPTLESSPEVHPGGGDWIDELPSSLHEAQDDLTPDTLLGDHREERWATRAGEDDDGLDDPDAGDIDEAWLELERQARRLH